MALAKFYIMLSPGSLLEWELEALGYNSEELGWFRFNLPLERRL